MVTEIVWLFLHKSLACRDEVRHLSPLLPCIKGNEALSHCDAFNLDENVKLSAIIHYSVMMSVCHGPFALRIYKLSANETRHVYIVNTYKVHNNKSSNELRTYMSRGGGGGYRGTNIASLHNSSLRIGA